MCHIWNLIKTPIALELRLMTGNPCKAMRVIQMQLKGEYSGLRLSLGLDRTQ